MRYDVGMRTASMLKMMEFSIDRIVEGQILGDWCENGYYPGGITVKIR